MSILSVRIQMSRNIEIKARVPDLLKFQQRAEILSNSLGSQIEQEDIFFSCPQGRLKLRLFGRNQEDPSKEGKSQLIFYRRDDTAGPKCSTYSIYNSDGESENSLMNTLALAYGVKGRVKKIRLLYKVGQTRIHLDRVENLGTFMELEVVLRPDESLEDGRILAQELMAQLGITPDSCVEGAYMDLLTTQ